MYPSGFNHRKFDAAFSGKMKVLDFILAVARKTTDDKFVLVSNYTQTIDSFEEVTFKRFINFLYVISRCCIRKYILFLSS